MGNRSWTVVGVLLTMAMINLSAFINYSFGYSLGLGGRGIQRPRLICASVSAARIGKAESGKGYTELTLISHST